MKGELKIKEIIKIIALKDLKVMLKEKMIWLPMLIVPFIMCVGLPILFFVISGSADSVKGIDKISTNLGSETLSFSPAQKSIYFAINFMFPGLFLFIPLLTSSVIAGSSFVGEKEGKTLEALFYTPVDVKDLFYAKLIGSFIIAFAITMISFFAFSLVVFTGQFFYFDSLIYPTFKWAVFIFWMCPAVILLGLIFMVWTSAKAKTFQEAQQKVGLLVIPVVLIIVGQSAGLFYLSTLTIFIAGAVVFVFDWLISGVAIENFKPEKLVF